MVDSSDPHALESTILQATGEAFRTIWLKNDNPSVVQIIDQRLLPHEFVVRDLHTWQDAAHAIREMLVRGAPLIGATAAWGLYLAAVESRRSGEAPAYVRRAAEELGKSRPTAVNLRWALDRMMDRLRRSGEAVDLVSIPASGSTGHLR